LHSVSTTKKGNSTSQQAFEDALTVLWILEHNKLVTPQARRARLYGIYRNLTKGRYNASDGQDIIARKLKRLGINSRNYKWFWLYKHLILPFAPAAGPLIPHAEKPLFSTGERTLP
ncbi:MAG: hypothetical protein K2L78_05200, partial [Muribaculaceae bacterium]|nr:hypothetical protein [Muribaculaceae bacterium]